jgi:hypothetical protein
MTSDLAVMSFLGYDKKRTSKKKKKKETSELCLSFY